MIEVRKRKNLYWKHTLVWKQTDMDKKSEILFSHSEISCFQYKTGFPMVWFRVYSEKKSLVKVPENFVKNERIWEFLECWRSLCGKNTKILRLRPKLTNAWSKLTKIFLEFKARLWLFTLSRNKVCIQPVDRFGCFQTPFYVSKFQFMFPISICVSQWQCFYVSNVNVSNKHGANFRLIVCQQRENKNHWIWN